MRTDPHPERRPRRRMPAADRMAQIVDTATVLISQRGYWGTAVQDVAEACELTVPGLLHHVGSKGGLLIQVLSRRDEADARALAELLGLEVPPGEWDPAQLGVAMREAGIPLATVCDAVVERNVSQPEIVRLYSVLESESLNTEHPGHDYFRQRQRLALAGFADQAPPGVDAIALAHHVLAVMDGLQVQWLRDPSMHLVATWRQVARDIAGLGA